MANRPAKARCEHCGAWAKQTSETRASILADTKHLLEAGVSEDETMRRVGYTHRASWQRTLVRAGLPALPQRERFAAPTMLTRIRKAGL